MSLLSKISVKNAMKNRRVSNAYMLYVKDQKKELIEKCPEESKNVIGAFFGEAWRSLGKEEKKVYFDKYEFLKKLDSDKNEVDQMKPKKESETVENSQLGEVSNTNPGAVVVEVKNEHLMKRECDEVFDNSELQSKKFKVEQVPSSTSKIMSQVSASTSKFPSQASASTSKCISQVSTSTSKTNPQVSATTSKFLSQVSASTSKFVSQVSASTSKNIPPMLSSTNKTASKMPASTNKRTASVEPIWKQKQKKKLRRCNPYMLFVKEKRGNAGPSYAKDKKCHANTVLGQIWKGLPSSEKTKYIDEAKLINSLQNHSASFSGKTKVLKKKTGKKSVGRPFKKAKTLVAAHIPNLRSMKIEEPEIKPEVTIGVNQSSDIVNGDNTAARNGSTDSQVSTDVSIDGRQQTNSEVRASPHQLPATPECNQPRNCFCWNTLHHLHTDHKSNDFNARPDGAGDHGDGMETSVQECVVPEKVRIEAKSVVDEIYYIHSNHYRNLEKNKRICNGFSVHENDKAGKMTAFTSKDISFQNEFEPVEDIIKAELPSDSEEEQVKRSVCRPLEIKKTLPASPSQQKDNTSEKMAEAEKVDMVDQTVKGLVERPRKISTIQPAPQTSGLLGKKDSATERMIKDSESDPEDTSAKRPVGRPRSKAIEPRILQLFNKEQAATGNMSGDSDSDSDPEFTPFKRPVGRPRKIKIESFFEPSASFSKEQAPAANMSKNPESNAECTPIKRPVGRPRKIKVEPISKASDSFNGDQAATAKIIEKSDPDYTPLKRPVGRPRKVKLDLPAADLLVNGQAATAKMSENPEPGTVDTPAKRPRGRPRKIIQPELQTAQTQTPGTDNGGHTESVPETVAGAEERFYREGGAETSGLPYILTPIFNIRDGNMRGNPIYSRGGSFATRVPTDLYYVPAPVSNIRNGNTREHPISYEASGSRFPSAIHLEELPYCNISDHSNMAESPICYRRPCALRCFSDFNAAPSLSSNSIIRGGDMAENPNYHRESSTADVRSDFRARPPIFNGNMGEGPRTSTPRMSLGNRRDNPVASGTSGSAFHPEYSPSYKIRNGNVTQGPFSYGPFTNFHHAQQIGNVNRRDSPVASGTSGSAFHPEYSPSWKMRNGNGTEGPISYAMPGTHSSTHSELYRDLLLWVIFRMDLSPRASHPSSRRLSSYHDSSLNSSQRSFSSPELNVDRDEVDPHNRMTSAGEGPVDLQSETNKRE